MDSHLKTWMLELVKTIEFEDKRELEEAYGVEFDPDPLSLACNIFCDDFKDASNKNKERLLKEHVVRVLDAACWRVTSNLHKILEEDGLDIEYLLHRACIELAAITKEKEHSCSKLWLHRVKKEYDDLKEVWHKFEKKWNPLLFCPSQTRAKALEMLKKVHEELVSYLEDEREVKDVNVSSTMFQLLNDLSSRIELSIDKELKQMLTVRASEIVKAEKRILSIPDGWPCNFSKTNIQDLEKGLSKRLFGQDHAIRAITSALSASHSGKGIVRSFLFACGTDSGGEELIKALAEQLFYNEQNMIEFDLAANNTELSNDEKCGFKGKLIGAVKKKPSTLIVLHNIDMAQASVTDFLLHILRNGKTEDGQGNVVDFTKTLIILTSDVPHRNVNMARHWTCDCALMTKNSCLQVKTDDHNCQYLRILKDIKQCFKPGLLDIIDDMIIFKQLIHSDLRVFTRLKLRKLASSIGGERIIVYPSEAALKIIVPSIGFEYVRTRLYLEENVMPKMLEICNQNRGIRSIVYIDNLVGTDELSYRVETSERFTGYQEFEQFLACEICQFWSNYQREILWLRKINGLRKTLQFMHGPKNNGDDPLPLEHLACKIRNLLTTESSLQPKNLPMIFKIGLSSSTELGCSHHQLKDRAKEEIDELRQKLFTRSVSHHYVFNVVAKAILSCLKPKPMTLANVNSHALTVLLLGLATSGKSNLRRDLTKLIDDDQNSMTNLLIQIKLSQCTDHDQFFKLIYAGHNQQRLGYPKIVGMRPGSILLIEQVEKAPMSVFSGLISLLDHRMLTDHQGCMIDLSNTVIIMVSDLGNKDFIVEMFEEEEERQRKLLAVTDSLNRKRIQTEPDDCVWEEYRRQPQRSHFRSELLNRVDEIVFFNPSVLEQLTCFARLSMTEGPHLNAGTPPGALSGALFDLFNEFSFKWEPLFQMKMCSSVDILSKGLLPQTSR